MSAITSEKAEGAKLTINMSRVARGRVHATAQLLGKTTDDFVSEVLEREVKRLGLINEKALAATA